VIPPESGPTIRWDLEFLSPCTAAISSVGVVGKKESVDNLVRRLFL
jgi:hypothetical protein